jgi:hypothetical protein
VPGIGQELLDRLVQHRTAPDHGLVVRNEVAHGQAFDTVGRGRDHHVADDDRIVIGPEHLGDREAVDVGIEQADLVAGRGQRDGQVDRHRRLADAALAGRHADDTGLGVGPEERRHRRGGRVPVARMVVPVAVVPRLLLGAAGHADPQPVP